jgi:hypothetical protein
MRVSGSWSLAGLVVMGLIAADFLLHPQGTKAAFTGVSGITKSTGNQLIGTPSK